jgi:hypothetical protein
MKKFFRFAAIAVAAIALFSCEKPPQGDDTQTPGGNEKPEQTVPEYTEDLTFTLAVTEVEADKAKIKVEHNGTTKDTWIGFETTETDIEKAIADFIAEGNVTLKKNTSTTMTVRGLEPETKYTFVAVGVKADGSVYGNHAIIEFTTAKAEEPTPPAPEGYTVNPNWTVTYIGEYEEGGKVYDNVVVVETTDTNPFFVTAWPVDYYEELGIEAIVAAEIEAWNEELAKYPGATWADIVYAESILSQVGIDPEYGTKWYAMAIGCDTNGKATGLYALSEVIDLENLGGGEDVELTPEYAAWLGDWTFTGANGVAWPITFSKGKANKSFIMTGWEGFGDLEVEVEWDATNQIWAAMIQNLGTFEFQGGKTGDVWFAAYDAEGYFYPVDGIPAFLGGYDEEGNRVAVGYAPQDNSGNTIDFVTAGYVIDFGADQYGVLSDSKNLLTFPVTITPATKAATCAVKEFKGGKKTLNPLAPKTFKAFSLCDMSVRTF